MLNDLNVINSQLACCLEMKYCCEPNELRVCNEISSILGYHLGHLLIVSICYAAMPAVNREDC